MIKGKRLVETFSGCGRLFDIYSKYKPSEILMVDLNKFAIKHAIDHCKGIKAICKDVLSWSRQEKGHFGVSIAFWGLCYLDLKSMGEFLRWVRDHV